MEVIVIKRLLVAAMLALLSAVSTSAFAGDSLKGVGVILIHGKAGGQGPLQQLSAALKSEGAIVLLPKMSWASGSYRPYEQTVGEVAVAVQRARSMGARKIVLAGHSMGANISFGYAASGGQVDAIVAMAPGHRPDFIEGMAGDSLARAQAMVSAGQGSQRAKFMDFNQGRAYPITTTAEAYVSFFDPRGPAGRAASGSGGSASVLWVVGTDDRAAMRDPATRSRGTRIEVGANHQTTPVAGVPHIIGWLQKTL